MSVATELSALTERLSNHIDVTEKAMDEDRRERLLAAAERREILAAVHKLQNDMEEVKPVTDFVKSFRAKLSGAIILLGFLGTIVWGGILFWKEQLINLFGEFFSG